MRWTLAWIVGGVSVVLGACGAFGGSDGTPAPTTPDDAGVSADGAIVADDASMPAHVDASGPTCTKSESFPAEADSVIGTNSDNQFGQDALCNVGIGAGIMRFKLSANAAAAMKKRTASDMSIMLTRAVTSAGCNAGADGGCLSAPFTTASGNITAAPLRSDWNEPQVTWNAMDKKAKVGWGVAGAAQPGVDRDAVIGSVPLDAVSPSVTIPVSAKDLDPKWVVDQADGTKVSFIVQVINNGNLTFITKEAAVASPQAPTTPQPILSITYPCP